MVRNNPMVTICAEETPSVNREEKSQTGLAGWYLLEPFCDGGDRRHSTGDGCQHVTVRPHRAVEVPLLRVRHTAQHARTHARTDQPSHSLIPVSPLHPGLSLWPLGPAGKLRKSRRLIWSLEAENEEQRRTVQGGSRRGLEGVENSLPLSCFPRPVQEYRYQEDRQRSHKCCMALSRRETRWV